MSLQTARYIVVAGISCVLVALASLGVVIVLRGGVNTTAPSVVALISFVGTLVGLLANLLATQGVATSAGEIKEQVNGHLAAHDRLAAEQLDKTSPSGPPSG